MGHRHTLLDTAQLHVFDSRCRQPRAGPTDARGGQAGHVALLRRGCFSYHVGARRYHVDACTALLHHPRVDYRIGHPGADGDDATVVMLGPALFDELWGAGEPRRPELALGAATHLAHARALAALRREGDALAHEEQVLALLQAVATDAARLAPLRGPAGSRRRTVARARELLGARLADNLSLTQVAAEAGCSPFHLMRLFRAETGLSLRAYRRQLRVLTALERLAAGEPDLGRLALELGFTHHSHLTQSVRAVLGSTPARLRAELRARARS